MNKRNETIFNGRSTTISLLLSFVLAASVITLRATVLSLNDLTATQHQDAASPTSAAIIEQHVHPETAAKRLQDPIWIKKLRHTNVGHKNHFFSKKWRRIIEWTAAVDESSSSTNVSTNNGVELFLMPHEFRSSQLIDLFLHGKVADTMGENVAMMGYAKAALALGCKRVLMFESYVDFIHHLDTASDQFYILDYISLPSLKKELLVDTELKQRTWEFSWWGRDQSDVQTKLAIPEEYGFMIDHALIPFNYTEVSKENVRLPVLPTAIIMNHVTMSEMDKPEQCHVFYMGKRVMDVENSTNLIQAVEDRIAKDISSFKDVRLCTAFQIPQESSYAQVLGFEPKYTVNVGRMRPTQFAHVVGNADVVVGSGWPPASPTIIDAIYGGAFFMAPSKQFHPSMEMHPLFIKSDELYTNLEEQVDEIVRILQNGDNRKHSPFGGYYGNTSYSIEYTCHQLLKVIGNSFFRQIQLEKT